MRLPAFLQRLTEPVRQDRWLQVAFALFLLWQLASMLWDLPGSHGWENDGIAPRDLFGGIAFNLTPGRGHRYPLLHYLIVGVASLPFLLLGALRARSFAMPDLMDAILDPVVMTGVSVTAKVVAVAMSLAAIATLARIGRRLFGQDAGRWAALLAMVNLSVAYYGRVSNLDGPYLMWSVLALDRMLDVIERGDRRDFVWAGVLVGAAVATKDQAYATLAMPLLHVFVVLPLSRPELYGGRAAHWRRTALAIGSAVLSLGLLGGGLLNPTGWWYRVHILSGTNSEDWRTYERSVDGVLANLADLWRAQAEHWWPWAVVVVVWVGVVVAMTMATERGGLRQRAIRALPLLAGVSHVVLFTLVVARTGNRFALPMGFWLALYGGVAIAYGLEQLREHPARPAAVAIALALLSLSFGRLGQLSLTQWGDARREVSELLQGLPPGSTVETYGLVVYLPHFDTSPESPYRVSRVDGQALKRRNPLHGATEVLAPYGEYAERAPDVIVIPEAFAVRYLPQETASTAHTRSAVVETFARDDDGRAFFTAALSDDLPGYRVLKIAEPRIPFWAQWLGADPMNVHACTGRRVWVLEKVQPAPAAP